MGEGLGDPMSKALKIAGAIVGVVAIVASGGLGAGIAAAVTSAIGVGASTLTLISAGLAIGSSLLAPRAKAPTASPAATGRLFASIELRTPRKIVFGRTALATDVRDQEYTDGQSWLHRFVLLASHKVHAVEEIWFDDKLAWTAAGGVQGEFSGYLTVTPVLEGSAANAINISSRMGATRRYTGLAYLHLRYKLTGSAKNTDSPFAQSIPTRMTVIGKAAPVYDPRLDSTVGGSGSQRANDQSTWAWNDDAARNPALQTLWYLLGWRIQNPSTGQWKLVVGKGIPPERIDIDSFITAANLCDEQVARAAGGTEPRYRSDGIFSEGDDPSLVLDNLKAAMNADLDDVDGKLRITVLHNDLGAPQIGLTADDVLDSFKWTQTPPLTDSFNVIRGSYTDPSTSSLYQQVDYPEVRIDSPDGIDRVQTVNLPMVQSASQAQRLVKQRLQRALYGGMFEAVFQVTAWRYRKGDVVPLTFPALGWSNKLFRVVSMTVQVDGTVPMTLREEHPDIYLWDGSDAPAVQGAAPTTYNHLTNPIIVAVEGALTSAELAQGQAETALDAVKDTSGNVVPVRDQIAAAQQALEQSIAQAQEDIAAAELAAESAQATAQAIESSVVGLVTTTIPALTQRITSAEGTITSQGTTLTTYDTRITNVTNQASTTAGSLALLTQTVQAGNPNLLPNGGFENGLANWALTPGNYAGAWGVTSSAAVYGRHAFAFATANNQTLFLSSDPIPVSAGLQYAASARMRVRGTTGRVVMDVLWFDANHQLIPPPNSSMIGGKLNAPTEFGAVSRAGSSAVTGTAPAGAAWARIRLIGENLSSGDQLAFQQVKFEIGSAPTAYSSEASIQQAFTVISTATEQVAQLGTTVGTQGSTITRIDSATTTLQGDMALVQTRLVAGSPNLLGNGGFEDGLRAWVPEIGAWGTISGNVWGNYAYWDGVAAQTTGERAVVLSHAPVLFDPGQEFTFTVDANAYNTANTAYCRLEVHFYADQAMTQQVGPAYGGNAITQPQFGHPPGQDRKRLAVSGVAPSYPQALWARCRIIFGNMTPIGGCGAAVRQTKFERSPAPTAYSNETSLRQSYQAISTLDGQRASMQTELNTAGTNITNLQSATSTLQGDVATVTQRLVAGSPNLLPNGGFENGMTSWRAITGSWINNVPLNDSWGAYVYWTGSGATTDGERYVILDSLPFPMEGNAPYVLSADANVWNTQGNAYCRLEALFYSDAAGTVQIGQHWGPNVTQPSFWSNPGVNRQNLALFGITPNGTQRCVVRLVGMGMYNGSNSGTAFRQVKFERGQRLTPYSSEASIHQTAQALSTATQQLSQLSQTVSTQGATVTQTATALTQLEGRVGGVESQYASLNSTVSSQGVTISNSATAITTLNGQMSTVFGQWVLDVDVNGRVAGMRLANNGQYSSLTFRSDLVVFENPNGGFRTVYANGGWKTYNAANIPVYEDGIY